MVERDRRGQIEVIAVALAATPDAASKQLVIFAGRKVNVPVLRGLPVVDTVWV